ncbi:MAG: oxygen-insensitive NAD(P)H nitroreductase [Hydrotalea sp.]|nr:oxygen-insensitive NAD(P)H nitroreductase [Hydrotalea sp.]
MTPTLTSEQLITIANERYTCKAFNPDKKIPDDQLAALKLVLRNAPSSVNLQPWHFIIASSDDGKKKIAEATAGPNFYNTQKLLDCSHVVVFCRYLNVGDAHLSAVLAKEDKDGRYAKPEDRDVMGQVRGFYASLHQEKLHDLSWCMEKQIYLALGMLLESATTLGIDSCAMEGFDAKKLDEVLDLKAKGLASVVVTALGYRADKDFNATLPKSRLGDDKLFTQL